MRQDDLDKLLRRFKQMSKDMMPPGADYKIVMIVAERKEEGIEMALGCTGDYEVASMISQSAAHVFAEKAKEDRHEAIGNILEILRQGIKDGTLAAFMRETMARAKAEDEEPEATKH